MHNDSSNWGVIKLLLILQKMAARPIAISSNSENLDCYVTEVEVEVITIITTRGQGEVDTNNASGGNHFLSKLITLIITVNIALYLLHIS